MRMPPEPVAATTWQAIGTQAVGALLSGTVVAALVGLVFNQRAKRSEQQRAWREAALGQVLGPAVMHMLRTRRAFERWKEQQLFLEMEVIGNSNRAVRDLLLANGHLLPADLIDHAVALVAHYDAWLEEFEAKRRSETPDTKTKFIFVGPKGYGFPREAEAAFVAKFIELRDSLYGGAQRGEGEGAAGGWRAIDARRENVRLHDGRRADPLRGLAVAGAPPDHERDGQRHVVGLGEARAVDRDPDPRTRVDEE